MSYKATLWAMEQETGSTARKAVLCAIASFADAQGETLAVRLKLICQRSEASKSTAQRAIRYFQEVGLLVRSERPGRADGYKLNFEHKTEVTVTGVNAGGGSQSTPVTVTPPATGVRVTGVSETPRSERPDTEVTVTGPTTLEHGLVTEKNIIHTTIGEGGEQRQLTKHELGWETWVLGELGKAMRVSTTAPAALRAWMAGSGLEWHELQSPVTAIVKVLNQPKRPQMLARCQSVEDFVANYDRLSDWVERNGRLLNQHSEKDQASREEELTQQVANW